MAVCYNLNGLKAGQGGVRVSRPLRPLSVPVSVEKRGVAQLGSALALGARGRRFKSARPDQTLRV